MSTSSGVPVGLKKVAVLCILKSSAGYLLLRRTKEPHLGKYIPTGGKLEPFETPNEAAKREIEEETGLIVNEIRLCGVMTETSPTSFNWINYIYLAEVEEISPVECEEGILEWIPQHALNDIPTPETDFHIYDAVAQGKFFVFNAVYDQSLKLTKLTDDLSGVLVV